MRISAGAISIDGYEVEPGGELVHYILPPVRRLPEAVRASLGMLEMGPAAAAAVCAVWRAPTAEFFPITVSLFMTGSTGYFKSALLGCAQAHWGARWDGVLFPANWTGTANALERTAFVAKDALLVVDDFNPKGTQYEVAAMHATADRLLRAQGNPDRTRPPCAASDKSLSEQPS